MRKYLLVVFLFIYLFFIPNVLAQQKEEAKFKLIDLEQVSSLVNQDKSHLGDSMWNIFMNVYGNDIKAFKPDYSLGASEFVPLVRTFVLAADITKNSGYVVDMYGFYNGEGKHGVILTIPQSAYFSDLKRFHFIKVEPISVHYLNFAKNIKGDKFTTSVRYYGKLNEPLFIIKGGDINVTLGGPTIFQFFYRLDNIFEKFKDKIVLDYVMNAKQATVYPKYSQFIVILPQGYKNLRLYRVDSDGNFQDFNSTTLTIKEAGNYKIVSLVVPAKYVKDAQVNIRAEYPENFVSLLQKTKEVQKWEKKLAFRLFVYSFLTKVSSIVILAALLIPAILGYILWVKYGKESFSKVYAPVYMPSKDLQSFSFGALSLLYNYEKLGAKNSFTRGLVADLLELIRKQIFKLDKEKNDLGMENKVLKLGKVKKEEVVIGKAASNLASYLQEKIKRLKKLYLDEFILPVHVARAYVKDAEAELEEAGIYDKFSIKMKKKIGIITVFLVGIGIVISVIAEVINQGIGQIIGVNLGAEKFVLLGLSLIIGGLINHYIYTKMQKLNKTGIKLYKEIHGLQKYIKTAEIKRIKFFNDPDKLIEHFEVLLPYAIIFKLEKKWLHLLKHILAEYNIDPKTVSSIYWYNLTPNDVLALEQSLNSFQSAVDSAISTVSSSGGSFSFSGGGTTSVGGGFSGGGGASTW